MMDGTWHKPGHSSWHAVVSSTGMGAGQVVDVQRLTRVCSDLLVMIERY